VIVIGFVVGAVGNAGGADLEVVGVVEAGHPLAERLLAGELHPAAHQRRGFSVNGDVKAPDREAAARRLAAGVDPDDDKLGDAGVTTVPVGTTTSPTAAALASAGRRSSSRFSRSTRCCAPFVPEK
jgi:hypothetical protein